MDLTSPHPISDWGRTWTAIGAFAGLVATLLLLLGAGVALSIETNFLIPYASSFGSPVELIELAPLALTNFFLIITAPDFFWTVLTTSIYPSVGIASVVFVVWLFFGGFLKKQRERRKETAPRTNKWFLGKTGDTRLKTRISEAVKFAIAASFVHPVMMTFFLVVCIAFVLTLSSIPLIGMTVSQQYFKQYVFEPTRCLGDRTPLAPHEIRALCVSVSVKDQAPVVGRLVTATNTVVVIYHPQSNSPVRAERIPLLNASIQTLTKLP